MRPNPDSQAHQQVVAADTMADPAVVALVVAMEVAATVVACLQEVVVVVAARFTSPTSVASFSYWHM